MSNNKSISSGCGVTGPAGLLAIAISDKKAADLDFPFSWSFSSVLILGGIVLLILMAAHAYLEISGIKK